MTDSCFFSKYLSSAGFRIFETGARILKEKGGGINLLFSWPKFWKKRFDLEDSGHASSWFYHS